MLVSYASLLLWWREPLLQRAPPNPRPARRSEPAAACSRPAARKERCSWRVRLDASQMPTTVPACTFSVPTGAEFSMSSMTCSVVYATLSKLGISRWGCCAASPPLWRGACMRGPSRDVSALSLSALHRTKRACLGKATEARTTVQRRPCSIVPSWNGGEVHESFDGRRKVLTERAHELLLRSF